MIDVQKLLGQFLGSHGHGGRPSHPGSHGSGGGLQSQLGGLMGGSGGSLVSAALTSGLAARLFRAKGLGRVGGGSTAKLGGAALVASLAFKAFQAYQAKQAGSGSGGRPASFASVPTGADGLPSASGTPFLPRGQEDRHARLMLSAMIAAAKADGYIDAAEQEAIFGRIDDAGLDAEEKGYLMDEMRKPVSIDHLVSEVRTPEEAAEVYTASVLAIDPDHPAERAYLDLLAARLRIDPALVAEIRRTTDEATSA